MPRAASACKCTVHAFPVSFHFLIFDLLSVIARPSPLLESDCRLVLLKFRTACYFQSDSLILNTRVEPALFSFAIVDSQHYSRQ